jgi:NitT/TauT family transport system substrate-binding protein
MKTITPILSCLILVGILFLNSCSKHPQESKNGLTKVKIAQFGKEKFLLYLPLYVAMEKGIFEKNGLEVQLLFAGNDDQVFATVVSDHADFAMGDPVFAAIAQEKGFGAKMVALIITNLGLSGYTNNPKVPEIKDPKQFEGLRIGSFPAPSTTFTLLSQLIKDNNLQKTKIVQSSMGTHLALLEANKIDIALDLEPAVSIAESKGYRVIFNLAPFTERQAITGIMVTQKMIDKNPELVQKVVNSFQEALTLIYKDSNVGYEVGNKLFPQLGEQVVKRAIDRMKENLVYSESVVVSERYWQNTLKTRVNSGELEALQPTGKAVDNSFAKKANP